MKFAHWTTAEDAIVVEFAAANYIGKSAEKRYSNMHLARRLASRLPGRTENAIQYRLCALDAEIRKARGLPPMSRAARPKYVGKPKMAPKPANGKRTRKCMCCTKPFQSEGPHNRLCYDCRRLDISPYAPGGA